MDILRNTSADKIEKIEVVTSPGASFRAAAGKAVINIVFKKEPGRGFDGSASVEGIYQFNKVSPRASLNMGYAGEKLIVSGNIGFRNTSSLLEPRATSGSATPAPFWSRTTPITTTTPMRTSATYPVPAAITGCSTAI